MIPFAIECNDRGTVQAADPVGPQLAGGAFGVQAYVTLRDLQGVTGGRLTRPSHFDFRVIWVRLWRNFRLPLRGRIGHLFTTFSTWN